MKIFGSQTVFDAALDRIRYLFDEFPTVVANISGGKDSTVVLNLCLRIAREEGRLPLNVMWIDQEVEWQGTVDLVESVMSQPDVRPYWFQMPMVITNNASSFDRYNYCWRESDRAVWIREKHPLSIKENRFGEIRFHGLFDAIARVEFPGRKMCYIAGVRAEESPGRHTGMTSDATYKWITWGRKLRTRDQFTFYPIFDWTYRDVWKAIHAHGWPYNRVYDEMFRWGRAPREMRISNLHHETAIQDLEMVQEIEPATWQKIAERIGGANTIKHMRRDAFRCPKDLPPMFATWRGYAEYLAENIIQEDKNRQWVLREIRKGAELFTHEKVRHAFYVAVINTILSSDWDGTKLHNFYGQPPVLVYRRWKKGLRYAEMFRQPDMLPPEALPEIKKAIGAA